MREFLKSRLFQFTAFIVMFIVLACGLVYLVSVGVFTSDDWNIVDDIDPGSILQNPGLLAIVVIALPFFIWRSLVASRQKTIAIQQVETAIQQAHTVARGQNYDRFQNAAANLGHDKLAVRQSGIFTLCELAKADPQKNYLPVQKTLCDFLRNQSALQKMAHNKHIRKLWHPNADMAGLMGPLITDLNFVMPCTSDMIEALRTMSDLRTKETVELEVKESWKPDLRGVNFTSFPGHTKRIKLDYADLREAIFAKANLEGANFKNANLTHANLAEANLAYADFNEACLYNANLADAYLEAADCKGADFCNANLARTDLERADLNSAGFANANLTKANLWEAILFRANLGGTNLTRTNLFEANLAEANLTEANFTEAYLVDADLSEATLTKADFRGADLKNAKLTRANLEHANFTGANLAGTYFYQPVLAEPMWPKGWEPTVPDETGLYTFIRVGGNEPPAGTNINA